MESCNSRMECFPFCGTKKSFSTQWPELKRRGNGNGGVKNDENKALGIQKPAKKKINLKSAQRKNFYPLKNNKGGREVRQRLS